jgi:hypothetical protein
MSGDLISDESGYLQMADRYAQLTAQAGRLAEKASTRRTANLNENEETVGCPTRYYMNT